MMDLDSLEGLAAIPVFNAVHTVLGKGGLVMIGLTVSAAIITGLIGNFTAGSRLLFSMAKDDIMPEWFGRLSKDSVPKNAVLFLTVVSVFIPFVGRSAIGWIIDVNTIGAVIAYGYTSACAFAGAKEEGRKTTRITGIIGLVSSVIFFFYFMTWANGAMATESYLILAIWSIVGFVYFRYVFMKDKDGKFGKTLIVWVGTLFLIFYTTLMWIRQATDKLTHDLITDISRFYEAHSTGISPGMIDETNEYISEKMLSTESLLNRNSVVQMIIIMIALVIMFSIYSLVMKRQKEAEKERIKAEEASQSKTIFLSNMSHDIRTPMNAIIGYANLADRDENSAEEMREYIKKIQTSSHHLLALINDVLEMSRIESGRMDLEPVEEDLIKTLDEARDMFSTQMKEKQIDFKVNYIGVENRYVYCDKNRLNRVLLNLISNAYKFTPEKGSITITLAERGNDGETASYELRVKDSGIGMSREFAEKVFDAFEREKTSTVSGIQGTGLGMAITKNIVDLMGGNIIVNTEKGKGTEFVIYLSFKIWHKGEGEDEDNAEDVSAPEAELGNMRILLVDDNEINREIATLLLEEEGAEIETASNGRLAYEAVKNSEPGYFDLVLMDVQMPEMNGYEATRAIRALEDERLSKVIIVAMTANAFSEDVKDALLAGMDAHLSKPIDIDRMKEVLGEIMGKKHV